MRYCVLLVLLFSACAVDHTSPATEKSAQDLLDLAGEASYGSPQWTAMLDSAIMYFPEVAEPYYRKGVRQIRNDDYLAGMPNLMKAAELDPMAYINYLGLIKLTDLHDFEGAVADFRKAISLGAFNDPVISGDARLRLGLALKELGKNEEAVIHISEYIEKTGTDKVIVYTYVHRGIAFEAIGDLAKARSDYEKALSLWPKCTEAYYFLGKLQLKTGDKKSACRNAQKAILYKSFIRTNPSGTYTDQLYYSDLEILFDDACR